MDYNNDNLDGIITHDGKMKQMEESTTKNNEETLRLSTRANREI